MTFNQTFKTKIIEDIVTNISNTSFSYYVGFGKNDMWDDDQNPPSTNGSIQSYYYDVQKDLLFGTRVVPEDAGFVIPRINWTENTVYDQYDNTDPNLSSKMYYVLNSSNRVYKCLFNNYMSPSIVMPEGDIAVGDFNTSDGYKWKYLYTISSILTKKFTTNAYIPVLSDVDVISNAEDGAIHVCMVSNTGTGYVSANGQIDMIIDNNTFKITNTNTLSIAGSYNLSTFYAGGPTSRSVSIISNYTVNTAGRYISTVSPITEIVNNSFVISPQVQFQGDGTGAFAICDVDPLHGEIKNIRVIARGMGYNYCTTQIVANSYFGMDAITYPIISPKNGHGANTIYELGCSTLGVSVSTDIGDNFPSWITYRQASLMYNPISTLDGFRYIDNTFLQLNILALDSFSGLMGEGEIVTGYLSGATGIVVYMNAEKLYLKNVQGVFTPYETVTGFYTGETAIPAAINTSDIVPYSSNIFYYKNIEPISRQGITTEQLKLYFSI